MAIVKLGMSFGSTFKNCVPERIFNFEEVCVRIRKKKETESIQDSLSVLKQYNHRLKRDQGRRGNSS